MDTWIGKKDIQGQLKIEEPALGNVIFDYQKERDMVFVVFIQGPQEVKMPLNYSEFKEYFEYIEKVRNESV